MKTSTRTAVARRLRRLRIIREPLPDNDFANFFLLVRPPRLASGKLAVPVNRERCHPDLPARHYKIILRNVHAQPDGIGLLSRVLIQKCIDRVVKAAGMIARHQGQAMAGRQRDFSILHQPDRQVVSFLQIITHRSAECDERAKRAGVITAPEINQIVYEWAERVVDAVKPLAIARRG